MDDKKQDLPAVPDTKEEPIVNDQERNELRVKVTELCGWKWVRHPSHGLTGYWERGAQGQSGYERSEWCQLETRLDFLPDYPNDLNACHEFEEDVPIEYWDILSDITGAGGMSVSLQQYKRLGHATAEQRCCAFVATMEKGEHHGR